MKRLMRVIFGTAEEIGTILTITGLVLASGMAVHFVENLPL